MPPLDVHTEAYAPIGFKVILTNQRMSPRKVVAFHEGSGSQKGIFAELQTHCLVDYVPIKIRIGNQLHMIAGILAHNLTRELQIQLDPCTRGTTAKCAALWCFREIGTLRRTFIQCAGRMIRPAGKLILEPTHACSRRCHGLFCVWSWWTPRRAWRRIRRGFRSGRVGGGPAKALARGIVVGPVMVAPAGSDGWSAGGRDFLRPCSVRPPPAASNSR